MKKLVVMFLCLMLLVSVAIAETEDGKFPGFYTPPAINDGQYPIEGENLKLTYLGLTSIVMLQSDLPHHQPCVRS